MDVPDGAASSSLQQQPQQQQQQHLGPMKQSQQQQQQQSQLEEVLAAEGEYAKNYNTLHHIGKGAFGFVKVARKLDDGQTVNLGDLSQSQIYTTDVKLILTNLSSLLFLHKLIEVISGCSSLHL